MTVVIPPTETEPKQEETALVLHAKKVNLGLEAFDKKKAELQKLAEEAKNIRVTDIHDKAQLKAVEEHRKKIKRERVAITADAKGYRDFFTGINKNISAKESELIAIVEAEEAALKAEEDRVNAALAKEEQDRIDAENARIQERINALAKYGVVADYNELKAASDLDFQLTLDEAQKAWQAEQDRIALQKQKEEEDRQAMEKEKQRLDQEKREQEQRQRDLEKKQEELKQQLINLRRQRVLLSGAVYQPHGKEYQLGSVLVPHPLDSYTDEAFENVIKSLDAESEKIKEEKKHQEFLKVRSDERSAKLVALGMHFVLSIGGYQYMESDHEIRISLKYVEECDDERFQKLYDETSEEIAEIKARKKTADDLAEKQRQDKAVADALQAEKDRQEKEKSDAQEKEDQATDTEKYTIIYNRLFEVGFPEMKSTKGKKAIAELKLKHQAVVDFARALIPKTIPKS